MSADAKSETAFARLLAIVTELREKCPWDREQKLADTPRHLIEEAYEVADAVARHEQPAAIAEELGDVIAQCLYLGVILAEQSEFKIAEVLDDAAEKLVRRHPHVYAGTRVDSVEQVLENWETIKQQERAQKTFAPEDSNAPKSLRHVGRGLPSMTRA
ncbi:MAG TPA: MazG nucleotide pyrophosphohydrolase domain-containing protein [Candidatus Acidoferrales bacterium]|nr:MazG nucleotide pyrophosphohydrolase domain-containing protein [Candidatus Acidoferrales bacterium]